MSLIVELWIDGRVREGADEWWDDVEAMLPDDAAAKFPLLSRVDPYGDAVFARSELEPLATEST